MNIYAFAPVAVVLDAAYGLLQFLSSALVPVAAANAAALAIVTLTILVRLVLIPVALSQARAQHTRERLAPRLGELRRLHAQDPERLRRETMGLYSSEGASPLAGCLPLLMQAPVLGVVYGLFVLPTINGHANDLLTHSLFGSPLGSSFAAAVFDGGSPTSIVITAAVVAVIGAIVLLSRHANLAHPAAPQATALRVLSWMPLVTVVFAAFVPLAASVYLAVTTTWTLIERTVLKRSGTPRARR